ncbi:MAG: glycerate-2-kinase family protein, partial [Chloroflexota bacterium]
MIIKNRRELALSELREKALDIAEAAVGRVLPGNLMKTAISYEAKSRVLTIGGDNYALGDGRLFVIGGGKASGLMAQTLEEIIGAGTITAGIVSCKCVQGRENVIRLIEAGHPIPDERGVSGVAEMLGLKEKYQIDKDDLVICLISGGGSALLPCPVKGVSLADKCTLTGFLLGCGAEIGEINSVRKHISCIKGGRLGEFLSPCRVVSLIISDVIGNRLDVIASGPTYPDSSTFRDAY